MPDIDAARAYMAAACRDAQALANMLDEQTFPSEIFGFHAQQAVEKCLKGWLCLCDVDPPHSHNIRLLLVTLEANGVEIDDWWEMVGLTAFAVQFRYEAFESVEASFDRVYWSRRVASLIVTVEALF